MSLQGSLDTFALSDVLTLLATTAKSGELRVAGPRLEGRLWLAGGELASAAAGRATDAVDVLFELLRLPEGTFVFTDGIPTVDAPPVPVAPALEEASRRLDVWREIEAVVPSLDVRVRLVPELAGTKVVVTAERWRALVAVAEGGVVGVVGEALEMGEFDACSAVKDLVDAGLVAVVEAEAPDDADEVTPPSAFDELEAAARTLGSGEPAEDAEAGGIDTFDALDALESAALPVDSDEPADDDADLPLAAVLAAPVEPALDTDDPAERLAAIAALAGDESDDVADGEHDPRLSPVAVAENGEVDDLGELQETDEPINRGLLLKFLSSVRS